jgi:DNA-directed RNA polymerase subunit RPC12/RpoP
MVDADIFCGASSNNQMICGATFNSNNDIDKWEYCPYCGKKLLKMTIYVNTNNTKTIYWIKNENYV